MVPPTSGAGKLTYPPPRCSALRTVTTSSPPPQKKNGECLKKSRFWFLRERIFHFLHIQKKKSFLQKKKNKFFGTFFLKKTPKKAYDIILRLL